MAPETLAEKIDVSATALLQRLPPARSLDSNRIEIMPLLIDYFDGGVSRDIVDHSEFIARLVRKIEITGQIWSVYNTDWSPAGDRQRLPSKVFPLLVLMLLHDAEGHFALYQSELGFKALNAACTALDIHAADALEQDLVMLEEIVAQQISQASDR